MKSIADKVYESETASAVAKAAIRSAATPAGKAASLLLEVACFVAVMYGIVMAELSGAGGYADAAALGALGVAVVAVWRATAKILAEREAAKAECERAAIQ